MLIAAVDGRADHLVPAHSVELLLDAAGEALVREQWQRLSDAGLPSQADHSGETNAPHVTLAVFSEAPDEATEAALPDALQALPIAARLGAPMLFGRTRLVLVRAVVPTAGLLALHASLYAAAGSAPLLADHVAPGRWTPHVTLARGIRIGQVGEALTALGPGADDPVTFVAARRWDPDARRVWTL